MTEAEWLVCDDVVKMLDHIAGRLTERKLLLFGTAIVRRHPDLLNTYGAHDSVDLVERFAEGQVSESDLIEDLARFPMLLGVLPRLDVVAVTVAAGWLRQRAGKPALRQRERRAQADLLRDIVGNPFRRTTIDPAWLRAGGGLIARLARVAAAERSQPEGFLDSTRLSILGDALEDAGCFDEQLLSHLREPGPHVRGCWVIDLLTCER